MANAPLSLNVTVLGSGTSQGVPMIGCDCAVCRSDDPRDARTRSSIYLTYGDCAILVDTTPDLRQQALREKLNRVDAVLFTHPHADHIMGFDDLRRFCDLKDGRMPIYGAPDTLAQLERIFGYAFHAERRPFGYVAVDPFPVEGEFSLGGLSIAPLAVPHGRVTTYGYLFRRGTAKVLAYLSDCKCVLPAIAEELMEVETLIIDGLRDQPHPSHLSISEAIEAGQRVRASCIYLTHLTHQKSHAARVLELPPGVFPAYDGMKLSL